MHDLKFTASHAERFLCDAIRHIDRIDGEGLRQRYKELGDATIYEAALKNGVVPIVAHTFAVHSITDGDPPIHWKEAFDATAARISSYLVELDRAANALAEKKIPLIALKNSGIVRGIYCHPGASPMGDIDVLIRPSDFFAAHKILEGLGYQLKFRNIHEKDDIEEAYLSGGAEYSVDLPSGESLWFELQWRPIAGRWIQPDQEPKADDLLSRSNFIAGSSVMLFAPEDNLLQVCLHTAKHSFVRAPGFRLHTDVDRIVSCEKIDWDLFISKVEALRVRTACYLSLGMARSLLGTPVPANVLARIAPPRWKVKLLTHWLDHVGVFNPDDRKWSNVGFIAFVAMLYDGPSDLWRAIFPSLEQVQKTHDQVTRLSAPLFHLKRLTALVLKRTGI